MEKIFTDFIPTDPTMTGTGNFIGSLEDNDWGFVLKDCIDPYCLEGSSDQED
jgi:hypothetical protein